MVTLLQENKKTETINGLLIRTNTASATGKTG